MTERLYTTRDAAAELDVPGARIRRWRHDGKVEIADSVRAVGRGNRGGREPLYRLDDLRPLAEAYHARRRHTETR